MGDKKTDFKNKAYIENYPTHHGGHENASYIHKEKNATSPGGHVFPLITTIFKLIQPLAKNVTLRKTAPPPGGHVFSLITTIFKLNQDIHKTNVLTKFHDNWDKKCNF
ncbi:hypothetical protein DPMN_042171 [Dreissena polymorpha]|uniref:Uncharacterized protein n=1 Tax=Dreissena polymorpha TaxID=45954 RepID=A0A9D4D0K2_DREPO|nr:hypothetical protein DPMN_042171 [Dreissena polymorpha]